MSKVSMEARTSVSVDTSLRGKRYYLLAELLVVLAAIAVFVPNLFIERVVTTDDCLYAWVGRNIVTGHGISDWNGPHTMFPPGYPFLIGLAFLIFGNLEVACRFTAIFAAVGTVLVVMLLARRMVSRIAGIAAGVFTAFNPSLIGCAYEGGSEVPFTFFCSLAMLAGIWSLSRKAAAAFGTGILVGAAYLIRPEALLLTPFYLLAVLAAVNKGRLKIIGLYTLGLIICVVPYAAFLHQNLGQWTLTGKSKTLVVDNPSMTSNPEHALYRLDKDSKRYSGDDIQVASYTKNASFLLINYLRNSKKAAGALIRMMGIPVLLLAFLTLPVVIRRKTFPLVLIPSLMPLPILLAMPLFFIRDRYLAAVVPMIIIWASWGFYLIIEQKRAWLKPLAGVLLCASVSLSIHSFSRILERYDFKEYWEHKAVGEWLNQHSEPGQGVMSRKPWIAFYADRPWIITPLANYSDTIKFAHDRGADFLVVDDAFTAKYRPALRDFLDPVNAPADLRPVYKVDRRRDGVWLPNLVLYELPPE